MIFRPVARDVVYVDRAALAASLRRPVSTIRDHCHPLACDVRTHALLYDAAKCEEALAAVPRIRSSRRVAA